MKLPLIPPFFLRSGICFIALMDLAQIQVQAQIAADNSVETITEMASKPHFVVNSSAEQWAAAIEKKHGRKGAADALAKYAADNFLSVDQLYSVRRIGAAIQTEFAEAVFQTLGNEQRPLAKGRLISLLRSTPLEQAAALKTQFKDDREGEELSARAIANGAVPFRVCDIAFNVLQELRKTEANTPRLLVRSMSFDDRDQFIAKTLELQSPSDIPNTNDGADMRTINSTPSVQSTTPKKALATSPTSTQNEGPPTLTSWSTLIVLIVAATGLLSLLIKRRL